MMLNMFMQHSFGGEFLDPSMDPSSFSTLSQHQFSLGLDACSPNGMLAESIDPWSTGQFPYMDYSGQGMHFEPQLTPSLSTPGLSASGCSVHSTPQLSPRQYSTMSQTYMPMTEPHVAFGQYSGMPDMTAIQFMQPTVDPNDPRVAVAVAICDRQHVNNTVHSLSHSLHNMLGHPAAASA